eukprot:7821952-Alexandrium_andersonii.AAC.1
MRTLEARVPQAVVQPDWPDKIYSKDLALLSQVGHDGAVNWFLANIRAYASNVSKADLDGALASL